MVREEGRWPSRDGEEIPVFARSVASALAAALTAAALASPAAAYQPKVLKIGFAPFENQAEVLNKAKPVVDALHKALGCEVQPFVAADYPGVVEAMKGGKLDVAFFSPAALVMAEQVAGAKVILKSVYKGRAIYYSAIIARADSPIKRLSDLKGKTFAFVDPGSTSGGVFPKLMLINAGLDPNKDFKRVIYAGGHDAAVLAVYNHKVDAAATFANDTKGEDASWTQFLTKGKESSQIVPIAFSKPVPSDNIAVASQLDPQLVDKVKKVFLRMSANPASRKILWDLYRVDAFVDASPADYEPVREAFSKVGLNVK
jgi:phosphonate transport system substrate-binding protein